MAIYAKANVNVTLISVTPLQAAENLHVNFVILSFSTFFLAYQTIASFDNENYNPSL
jgi:hypothetical protein